jgi:hypothetical protein
LCTTITSRVRKNEQLKKNERQDEVCSHVGFATADLSDSYDGNVVQSPGVETWEILFIIVV